MRNTDAYITSQLREKLQMPMGRHLYGVLGTYQRLREFEERDLANARDAAGHPHRPPVNLNRALLERIGDEDLSRMVAQEARRPQATVRRLGQELQRFLDEALGDGGLLILKQLEILFAYALDLSVFRIHATDRRQILLLLPGTRVGGRIILFHEAEERFQRTLPEGLIVENHLWELSDG